MKNIYNMMNLRQNLFWIILGILPSITVRAAIPYQLPGIVLCNMQSSCAVTIDSDGFLRDSASREEIFDLPFQQTVFDSYSLLKSGKYYIVERSNTTSSRNWDLLVLTYVDGVTHAERVISLSRGFPMKAPQVFWSGRECRGNAQPERQYSPFDASIRALCGENRQPDSVSLKKDTVITMAKKHGLVVDIPIYGIASKRSAVYYFPGKDEPDAGSLLCLKSCKSKDGIFGHYGGWIRSDLWIDAEIERLENPIYLTGSYIYFGGKRRIEITGKFSGGKLSLRELSSEDGVVKKDHATFDGRGSYDAFAGKWHSIESDKVYNFIFASRIY
jgi:hypothetical protein